MNAHQRRIRRRALARMIERVSVVIKASFASVDLRLLLPNRSSLLFGIAEPEYLKWSAKC